MLGEMRLRILQLFWFDPEKVSPSIRKRPYVILILAVVIGVGSFLMIVDWFEGTEGLTSLVLGLFCLVYAFSSIRLWLSLKRLSKA